jgi:hypothetical protein
VGRWTRGLREGDYELDCDLMERLKEEGQGLSSVGYDGWERFCSRRR